MSYNVAAVLDLTPGQGALLETCLDLRIPVLAICLTDVHCEQLEERLTHYCSQKFVDSSHTLYRPDASKFLTAQGTWKEEKDQEEAETKKKSEDDGGKKKKPKIEKETKDEKKKKRKSSDEDSEEGEKKKKKKKKNKKSGSSSSSAEQW